jgi:acyl-coenzyme A thioesterase PaaI-like protein
MTNHGDVIPAGILEAREAITRNASATPDMARIRAVVDAMVPFTNHVGVHITELTADGAVAELEAAPHFLNHLGTVHAGALFLAAEVAAAGAFSGAFARRLGTVRYFVLRSSQISFLKPARGRIRAAGSVDAATVADVLTRRTAEDFALTGLCRLFDDARTLVAQVDLTYLCSLGPVD